MEYRILHWYHDLLNLYGDYGNPAALVRGLARRGQPAVIDRLSFHDAPVLSSYDLVFLGSGTERGALAVLEDLRPQREHIRDALAQGVPFLATGNAFELFGRELILPDGSRREGLALFDFSVELTDRRTLCDQICRTALCEQPCVGFLNRASRILGVASPLFTVLHGVGNTEGEKGEGIREGSFYGTHLTGPCLIKNPHLADCFVALMTARREQACPPPEDALSGAPPLPEDDALLREYERRAYSVTLEALTRRFADEK